MNNLQQKFSDIRSFEQYVQERAPDIQLKGNLSKVASVWSDIKANAQRLNQTDFFVYLDKMQIIEDLTKESSNRIMNDIEEQVRLREREERERERQHQAFVINAQRELANQRRENTPFQKVKILSNIIFFFSSILKCLASFIVVECILAGCIYGSIKNEGSNQIVFGIGIPISALLGYLVNLCFRTQGEPWWWFISLHL